MSDTRTLDPESLFEHTQWMRRLAQGLVRDASRADDLVQDAWKAVLERPPAPGVPLRAWLTGILKRSVQHQRRTDAHRSEREAAHVPQAPGRPVDELAACAEEQRFLLGAILELPEKYREVLLLRFYDNLPPREIAARLDANVNTVRTRIERGLERLRGELDARHGGDREAWGLALLPLAVPGEAVAAKATVAAGSSWVGLKAFIAIVAMAFTGMLAVIAAGSFVSEPDAPESQPPALRSDATVANADGTAAPGDAPLAPATTDERVAAPVAVPPGVARVRVVDTNGNALSGAVVWGGREPTLGTRPSRLDPPEYKFTGGLAATAEDGSCDVALKDGADGRWIDVVHRGAYLPYAVYVDGGAVTEVTMLPLLETDLRVEVVDVETDRRLPRTSVVVSALVPRDGRTNFASIDVEGTQLGEWTQSIRYPEGCELDVRLRDPWGMHLEAGEDQVTVTPVAGGVTVATLSADLERSERSGDRRVLTGEVVDAVTKEPVAGARILTAGNGEEMRDKVRAVQSWDDGKFRMTRPGSDTNHMLVVDHPHYEHRRVLVRDETEVRIELVRRARLRGLITDRDGKPIPHAPLLLARVSADSEDVDDSLQVRQSADEDGRYEFEHLSAGTYRVNLLREAMDSDDDALRRERVRLSMAEDRVLDFDLGDRERVTVRGTVTPREPLEYGVVPAFLPTAVNGEWTQARVDPNAKGRYVTDPIRRGSYVVVLLPENDDHDGPFAILPPVQIRGFGATRMDFRYPENVIRGRVEVAGDAEGLTIAALPKVPEGTASEFLSSEKAAALMGVPVAADGTFELDGVANGTHELRLFRDGGYRLIATRDLEVSGSRDIGAWRP